MASLLFRDPIRMVVMIFFLLNFLSENISGIPILHSAAPGSRVKAPSFFPRRGLGVVFFPGAA